MRPVMVATGLLWAVCGCFESASDKRDTGGDPGPAADAFEVPEPTATFVSPVAGAPISDRNGGVDVQVDFQDPAGRKFTSLKLKGTGAGTMATAGAADLAAGTWSAHFDTGPLDEGPVTLTCTVATEDDRVATATVEIVVDDTPPRIEETVPRPADGVASGPALVLGYRFVDPASGVGFARITVDGNPVWTHDAAGGPTPKQVEAAALQVPTAGWTRRTVQVAIEARDAAGNEASDAWDVLFLPATDFGGAGGLPVPETFQPGLIEGMALRGESVVILGSPWEIRAYRPTPDGLVETWKRPSDPGESLVDFQVADMDRDGLDDLVLLTNSRVRILRQDAASGLQPAWASPPDATNQRRFTALAVGLLNDDGWPDVAAAVDTTGPSLAFCLSREQGGNVSWQLQDIYGGVPSPNLVAIGRLTADAKGRNDVLLSTAGSQVMTVFEVDETSGIPFGGRTQILKVGGKPTTGLLALGTFRAGIDKPAVAVFTDNATSTLSFGAIFESALEETGVHKTGLYPHRMISTDLADDGVQQMFLVARDGNMFMQFAPAAGTLYPRKAPVSIPLAGAPLDLAAADLIGDPVKDVAILVDTSRKGGKSTRAVVLLPFRKCEGGGGAELALSLGMLDLSDYDLVGIQAGEFLGKERDGRKDLAILAWRRADGKPVIVLVAADPKGSPTLQLDAPIELANLAAPRILLAGDLDNAGLDDLVVVTDNDSADCLRVVRFLPSDEPYVPRVGMVAPQETCPLGRSPRLAVLADLDAPESGPGLPDLALVARVALDPAKPQDLSEAVLPVLGNGDGTFTPGTPVALSPDRTATALTAAPFRDRPRWPDVAVAFGATSDFAMVFQHDDGAGRLESPTEFIAAGLRPQGITSGRLDGPADPYPDVVTLLQNDVVVTYATLDKGSLQYSTSHFLGYNCDGVSAAGVDDLNGDGWADLAVVNAARSTVEFQLNVTQQRFKPAGRAVDTGVGPTALVLEDLDGDDRPDLVTMDKHGRSITFYRNLFP